MYGWAVGRILAENNNRLVIIYLAIERTISRDRGQDGRCHDLEHDEQIGGVQGVRQGLATHLAAEFG